MYILVTNDDGIDAEGLEVLIRFLRAPGREIVVVAPDGERSGVSHAVTLRHPTKVRRLDETTWTCSGTPADCVVVAGLGLLPRKPDAVVSGINRGPNLGTDIIYSGTCGAARQAALAGVPSIAVSCAGSGRELAYEACAAFVSTHLEDLLAAWRPDTFINVNGPSSSDTGLAARWSSPGRNRYHDTLTCFDGADGFTYCFLAEGRSERDSEDFADHRVVAEGEIAVSRIVVHPVQANPEGWEGKPFSGA